MPTIIDSVYNNRKNLNLTSPGNLWGASSWSRNELNTMSTSIRIQDYSSSSGVTGMTGGMIVV